MLVFKISVLEVCKEYRTKQQGRKGGREGNSIRTGRGGEGRGRGREGREGEVESRSRWRI